MEAWGQARADKAARKEWDNLVTRAKSGDRQALHTIQNRLHNSGDSDSYEAWCLWGAQQEDVLSIFRVTEAKSYSGGVDDASDDSINFVRYYAEKKIPWAMYLYGLQVWNRDRNYDESVKYLRLAADSGVSSAQYVLGFLLDQRGFKSWRTADDIGDNAWDRFIGLVNGPASRWGANCPWNTNEKIWANERARHALEQLSEELQEIEDKRAEAGKKAEKLRSLVGQDHLITYADRLSAEVYEYLEKLRSWTQNREGKRPESPSFHLVLTGAPGTGKNEAARALGQWLFAVGYTQSPEIVEVSRADLVAGYVGQTAIKTRQILESALNKVLFIDEAYNLKSDSSVDFGQEAIDTLLKFMEDHRGSITVIVAGYQREMKSFLRSNPGLSSRFNETIHLRNLYLDELGKVFESLCAQEQVRYGDDIRPALNSYFKALVDKENFGNAREVRKLWERGYRVYKERIQQAERSGNETYPAISFDDVFGHLRERIDSPSGRAALEGLLQNLDSLVGLDRVKAEVRRFVESELARFDDPDDSWLERRDAVHMLLLGPPGTGKTEVARIIGRIFHLIGLVPEDSFTELSRSDLVGSGPDAAARTMAVLDSCLGGVVFIDEIYTLVDRRLEFEGGSSETLETVMKYMEDHRGELVVIGAGYADKLAKILEVNPGLASRFGLRLNFDAYNADELTEIFRRMCVGRDLAVGDGVLDAVRSHFAGLKRDESFGNAREVRNLIEAAERAARSREAGLAADPDGTTITISDLPVKAAASIGRFSQAEIDAVMGEIDGLVGVDGVKESFTSLIAFAKVAEKRRAAGLPYEQPSLHFTFSGPPGTGKTTVARLLGRLFKGLGLLSSGHVVEASRGDLVAGYVGQTALKTEAIVERSLGGVLFIDEAYSLVETSTEHNYSAEAISTLLLAMENHRTDLSLVFAGYTDEMEQFVATNPGLRSRIGNTIVFQSLTSGALLRIAERQLSDRGYVLSAPAADKLMALLETLGTNPDFGNARGVRRLVDSMVLSQSVRLADEDDLSAEALSTIADVDVAATTI